MNDPHDMARKMLLDGFRQVDIVLKTGLPRSAVAGIAYRMRQKGEAVPKAVKSPPPKAQKNPGPHIIHVPRERDEEVLVWMRRRRNSMKVGEIALRSGTGAGQVSMATESVRRADIKESGEDPRVVAKAYWPTPVAFGRHGRGRFK